MPNRGADDQAFTLVEVMIAVGIMGILASLAIPTFSSYITRTRWAEAYQNLGSLVTGYKAYYQAEHWTEGMVTGGASDSRTHCTVGTAFVAGGSGSKRTVDWSSEDPAFAALNFAPADPIYLGYRTGKSVLGTGSYIGNYKGACGHPPLAGIAPADAGGVVQVEVVGAVSAGRAGYYRVNLCSNNDNVLYVCRRRGVLPKCNFSPVVGNSTEMSGGLVAFLGCCLLVRRRKKRWRAPFFEA